MYFNILDDSGRGSVSGNSATNFDDSSNYILEQERKYTTTSINNTGFYPDLLRSSSTHGLPVDVNSGSSSVDSDSTLVAVQDTDVDHSSTMQINNEIGWFNEMRPVWQTMYTHNNHYENYIHNPSLQQYTTGQPQFQHLNYNYADLDMSHKNGGNFLNLPSSCHKQQWANNNELNNQSRDVVIDHDNHHQVNDHHDHYHPLQTVGILFNGPANEQQLQRDDARFMENTKRLQQKHQTFLGKSDLNKRLLSREISETLSSRNEQQQQNSSKINIYPNSNWKQQHLDEGGLATLPRRPSSSHSFHPYDTELQLSSNYHPHLMRGFKINLSQPTSSSTDLPGL